MTWTVVAAGGAGARFIAELRRTDPDAAPRPKHYLDIDGEPLIAHALHALLSHPALEGVVVALAPGDTCWPGWSELDGKPVRTCIGGASRAESVLAGLEALPDSVRADDFVLVHDAARPNLSEADLGMLLERGRADPVGAILATPVRDTLKRAGDDGGIDATEPRERLWRALTPQLFRRLQLQRALETALRDGVAVTDEAMAMERVGARPLLVEGSETNLKVTTPADLAYYRYLRQSTP